MSCCGGTGEAKPADAEIQKLCDDMKPHTEKLTGKTFSEFTAKSFKTQVVAGMNYFVKVHVGGGDHVHIRVYRPLPHTGEAPSLSNAVHSKKAEDELEYF